VIGHCGAVIELRISVIEKIPSIIEAWVL